MGGKSKRYINLANGEKIKKGRISGYYIILSIFSIIVIILLFLPMDLLDGNAGDNSEAGLTSDLVYDTLKSKEDGEDTITRRDEMLKELGYEKYKEDLDDIRGIDLDTVFADIVPDKSSKDNLLNLFGAEPTLGNLGLENYDLIIFKYNLLMLDMIDNKYSVYLYTPNTENAVESSRCYIVYDESKSLFEVGGSSIYLPTIGTKYLIACYRDGFKYERKGGYEILFVGG